MKLAVLLVALAGCLVDGTSPPPTTPTAPPPPEVKPDWVARAEANEALGTAAYAQRVAQAPKRAPGDQIRVTMVITGEDIIKLVPEIQEALKAHAETNPTPSVVLVGGGGKGLEPDWYTMMSNKQSAVDVFLFIDMPRSLNDVALQRCPDVPRAHHHTITARWSSAYVRAEYLERSELCKEGSDTRTSNVTIDRERAVTRLVELLAKVSAHIDTTVRQELPASPDVLALTPPYRAHWQWRRSNGSLGGGSIFNLIFH
jgi:hypothetical protein